MPLVPGICPNLWCMGTEELVHELAERVRAAIAQAEEKAAQIIRDAEDDARQIRADAEGEARKRLDEVREALAWVEGSLNGGAERAGSVEAEVEPGPVTVPEPAPPEVPEPAPEPSIEPGPEPVPEPAPEPMPEPTPPPDEADRPSADRPSTEELIERLKAGSS